MTASRGPEIRLGMPVFSKPDIDGNIQCNTPFEASIEQLPRISRRLVPLRGRPFLDDFIGAISANEMRKAVEGVTRDIHAKATSIALEIKVAQMLQMIELIGPDRFRTYCIGREVEGSFQRNI